MTEAEFDQRLALILQGNATGVAGFADIFGVIKNAVVKVGSGLSTAVQKVAGSAASIGSALTSPAGQSLLQTAAQLYVTKQAAKIEENKIQLQAQLQQQGVYATSPQAQTLLRDVATGGIVDSSGRVLVPGVKHNTQASFSLGNLTPLLLVGGGALLVGLLMSPRRA